MAQRDQSFINWLFIGLQSFQNENSFSFTWKTLRIENDGKSYPLITRGGKARWTWPLTLATSCLTALLLKYKTLQFLKSSWKSRKTTRAPQPSAMGRREAVCAVVPSSRCPGLPASRQAGRRNPSCQIRWAHGDQSGCIWTAKRWAEPISIPARAVQVWVPLKIHIQWVMRWSRENFTIRYFFSSSS